MTGVKSLEYLESAARQNFQLFFEACISGSAPAGSGSVCDYLARVRASIRELCDYLTAFVEPDPDEDEEGETDED